MSAKFIQKLGKETVLSWEHRKNETECVFQTFSFALNKAYLKKEKRCPGNLSVINALCLP